MTATTNAELTASSRAAGEAEPFDSLSLRQEPGAEYQVPDDQDVAVVVVGLCDQLRVVPAVQLRAAEDIVERAEAHVAVGVLVEAGHAPQHVVDGQGILRHAEQNERHYVDGEVGQLLEGVHPGRVHPVEPVRRVVHGVEAPQPHEAVQRPVDPVADEVDDEQHQHDLHDDRQAVGPQAVERPVSGLDPFDQPERDRQAQQVRHHHVEGHHERRVGADLAH